MLLLLTSPQLSRSLNEPMFVMQLNNLYETIFGPPEVEKTAEQKQETATAARAFLKGLIPGKSGWERWVVIGYLTWLFVYF